MATEKLTAERVAHISKPGKYGDGNGLYLQVTKCLVKSWVFRYQKNGIERYMGLGPLHAVDINEAREEARKVRTCLACHEDEERAVAPCPPDRCCAENSPCAARIASGLGVSKSEKVGAAL